MANTKATAPPQSADQNDRKAAAPANEPDQEHLDQIREHLDAMADNAEAIKERADELLQELREMLGAIDDEAYERARQWTSTTADDLDSDAGALRDANDKLHELVDGLPERGPGDPAEDDDE